MLGLIFIYWVGKTFYELANKYNKSNWAYAILGVVAYYGGIFIGGFLIGGILEIVSPGFVDEDSERWLGFLMIPVGGLVCWGTYTYLKNSWSKPPEVAQHTLDSDLIPSDRPSDSQRYKRDER
jgi:hypothetical protein